MDVPRKAAPALKAMESHDGADPSLHDAFLRVGLNPGLRPRRRRLLDLGAAELAGEESVK